MRHSPHPPPLDARIQAAWQTQLAAASTIPGLLPELVRCRPELLPRFAACYTKLRALPRRVRRALQRQWRLPLASVALLLALGQPPGLAATIPVGGTCTLADAIAAANTDTATNGCPAGSRADTIVLPAGSIHTLTSVNNSTYGPTGLPVVSSVITIAGNGSTITRTSEAPDFFRILAVSSTGELTLQETTVSGGVAFFSSSDRDIYGGGMANFGGTLTVMNSTISGNGADGPGGGVANVGGTLTVLNSTILGNFARSGGGVANDGGGTLTVTDSTISGNYGSSGGGVANFSGGTLTVLNSTISGNSAYFGGGVANDGGTCTVLNSTISGNFAYEYYGGGDGGGVFNSGTLTVLNSTISGNSAGDNGGGVLNYGPLTLARTLVTGNTASPAPEIANYGTVLADNHNLFGVDGNAGVVNFSPGATDIVPPAGVLLPDILNPTLANYGGPTQVHALVPGSPAIDAAGPVCLDATGAPLPTDQRGKPRIVDGDENGTAACDVGAFEFAPLVGATITVNANCTLVDAITAANTDTATGGCPAGSGADTIILPAGSIQTLTSINNSTYGPTGLPVIRGMLTIEGQGSTIARASSAPEFRLLAVNSIGDLTLKATTISGGAGVLVGGGVANYSGTLSIINSTITGNAADFGGGVNNRYGTVTVTNSTISGNASTGDTGGIRNCYGTFTISHSTIADNTTNHGGGGVANCHPPSILTISYSTISGNTAFFGGGGGINNNYIMTITNSTISGNGAGVSEVDFCCRSAGGGGVRNEFDGILTVTNSTISGNSAPDSLGGGIYNFTIGTVTLANALVTGNTAPSVPEIYNANGTVNADNHNLFGVNGNAGVAGFTPGATDIVPRAGVQLSNILNPVLAFNGGPTQTHVLVLDSPAIDTGGPVCTDANGNPLLTDQRGKPHLVDGDGDGTAACDIGAVEFFPLVNDFVTLAPAPETAFDPTPVPDGPAGTFTITATFTNTSDTPLRFPFFTVTELSGGNLLLNADEGTRGVGATLTPEVGDSVLAPGEAVTADFVVGLQAQAPFTFFVDLFGEPMP